MLELVYNQLFINMRNESPSDWLKLVFIAFFEILSFPVVLSQYFYLSSQQVGMATKNQNPTNKV